MKRIILLLIIGIFSLSGCSEYIIAPDYDYGDLKFEDLGINMVYVEGGTFQMGATSEQNSDYDSDELPVRSVTLDSYYIAETEVTQAQWCAVMGYDPSSYSGDNKPVEHVSRYGAKEFCERLSQLTGKTYTLPTWAQWEYAARGGNKSRGYKYSGSNTIDAVAWYAGNSSRTTHSVKQKQPNELGLYDMSGNVLELCSEGAHRGGSWDLDARYCRVSFRGGIPLFSCYCSGFRIVCIP